MMHSVIHSIMKSQHVKLAFAAMCMMLAIAVAAALGYLRSPSDALILAVFAVAPPAAMWFWWNDPDQTLSESIQAARRTETDRNTIGR